MQSTNESVIHPNENTIQKILNYLSIIYETSSHTNVQEIEKANKQLQLFTNITNLDYFISIISPMPQLTETTNDNIYLLFYTSTSLSSIISSNYLIIPNDKKEIIIKSFSNFLITNFHILDHNKAFILRNITSTLSKTIRFTMYNNLSKLSLYLNDFLNNIPNHIPYLYRKILSFDLLNEIIISFKDETIPPIDKVKRIIFDFEDKIQFHIETYILQQILEIVNEKCDDNNLIQLICNCIKNLISYRDEFEEIDNESINDKTKKNKAQIKPVYAFDINNNTNVQKINDIYNEIDTILNVVLQIQKLVGNEITKSETVSNYIILITALLYLIDYKINQHEQNIKNEHKEKILLFINNLFPEEFISNLNSIETKIKLILISSKIYNSLVKDNCCTSSSYLITNIINPFTMLILNNFSSQHDISILIDLIQALAYVKPLLNVNKPLITFIETLQKIFLIIEQYLINTNDNDETILYMFTYYYAKLVANDYHKQIIDYLISSNTNVNTNITFRIRTIIFIFKRTSSFSKDEITTVIISKIIPGIMSTLIPLINNNSDQNVNTQLIRKTFFVFISYIFKQVIFHKETTINDIDLLIQQLNINITDINELIYHLINMTIELSLMSLKENNNLDLLIITNKLLTKIETYITRGFNHIKRCIVCYCNKSIELDNKKLMLLISNQIRIIIETIRQFHINNVFHFYLEKHFLKLLSNLYSIYSKLYDKSYKDNEHLDIISNVFNFNNSNLTPFIQIEYMLPLKAFLKSINTTEEYETIIGELSIFLNKEYLTTPILSLYQIRSVLKLCQYVTNNKHSIISFRTCKLFPYNFIEFIYEIVIIYLNRKSNRELVFIIVKILFNILSNSRKYKLYSNNVNYNYILQIWNKLANIFDNDFTVSELIGHNHKLRNIFSVIKHMFLMFVSNQNNNTMQFSFNLLELIIENIDSLDNVILISTHECVFNIGKMYIENENCLLLKELFYSDKSKSLFIKGLNKIVNALMKGEITSLQQIANSMFVLLIIYENDILNALNENNNNTNDISFKYKELFSFLLKGISKCISKSTLSSFKENILTYTKSLTIN